MQTKTCISVMGGRFFDFMDPFGFDYSDIDMIAGSLSNICRFTGHVNKFYSVAEHSVNVSRLVPEKYAMEGLMHDASEAFVGDVSSPLKALLPQYRDIEEKIQEAICRQYGLAYPFPDDIHEADKKMYWNERKNIAPADDRIWHQERAAARKVNAVGMAPNMAKRMFLSRYREIKEDMK